MADAIGEEGVKSLLAGMSAAWDRGDGAGFATVFTEDADSLRESIGVSGQRMSALELLRKSARTVDRSRTAERPLPPDRCHCS